ncbi:MAG: hypothetical protein ACRC0G_00280 [Fusobacteriaceae bacterium]
MIIVDYKTPSDVLKPINEYLQSLNSKNEFVKILKGKLEAKFFTNYSKKSISSFKKTFGLNLVEGNKNEFYNIYIKHLNNFIVYNETATSAIRSEVFSSFIACCDSKVVEKILKDYKNEKTLSLFNSETFSTDVYNNAKSVDNVEQVFYFLKKTTESCGVPKIVNETKKLVYRNELSIKNLVKAIGLGMKMAVTNKNELSTSSVKIEDMTSDEKLEWLKKYSADTKVYMVDILGSGGSLLGMDYNSIFNPEFTTLNRINEKYKSFVNSIVLDEQNCSLYKTLIYLAIFLGREKIDCLPTEYMNKMINRDSRWATGTAQTSEPSFYGDSDVWKAIYGYAPFIRGEKNPFAELINNSHVDVMDTQAILMHKWFNENGLSKLIYEAIYEKGVLGENSIYDVLNIAKDLINLLEEPIVASSALDNLTAAIKGIVSGMINTFVSTIDFSLSSVARKLFYKQFIPTGSGANKISIAELHDYLAFISTILKQYENGAPTSSIDKDTFVSQIYSTISSGSASFSQCGYGAFDYLLNNKNGMDLYNDYLECVEKEETFYLSRHMKSIHALIVFATQKETSKYGSSYVNVIDYGNQSSVKAMISKLTKSEIYYVFKKFNIVFLKMDKELKDYYLENIIEFNDTLRDAQLYTDLNLESVAFYNEYLTYDQVLLSLEMEQDFFSSSDYVKYINKSINLYFNFVNKNKNNLSKAILDVNNVSDVDDFLLRFLPSFEEIARALGLNTGTIGALIKVIDYICEFITSILFKKLYLDIKSYINDYVKAITEDLFTIIDEVGNKLGGSNSVVIKFEFGGRFISGKLDSLMKILDDFTLTSKFLDKCFTDPYTGSVHIDDLLSEDGQYYKDKDYIVEAPEFEEEKLIIILPEDRVETESSKGEKPNVDKENEASIKDEELNKNETFIDKAIDNAINKKDPPKYITFEKGDITITTENGSKIIIVSKDDKKDDSLIITQDTYDKIENEIISKDEIGQLIEIRDFVNNITNKVIIDIQDELNKTKNKIQTELDKSKPDNNILKDLIAKEQELVKQLDEIKNKTGIITSNVGTSSSKIEQQVEEVVLHDYANGNLDLNKLSAVLEDLDSFTKTSKIPLTTAQIMELLK